MASIDVDWPEPQAPDQALGDFRAAQSRAIEKKGYRVTDMSPRSITYTRRFAWPKESFTVAASEDNGGAVVSVQGKIRPKLRKSLRELAKLRNTEFEHGSEDINGVPVLEPVPDPDPDPEPEPEESEVEEIHLDPGPDLEPAAQNGNESPLVREVRDAGLVAEGRQKRVEAEEQGDEIDCAEMEEELQRIYEIAGFPSAFAEALGKIEALAEDLCHQAGCRYDEAVYIAYRRSLLEHRDYLVTRGISRQVAH